MIEKRLFQKISKGDVYAYILDNGKGLKAEILSLGGIIRKLEFVGTDVLLGRDNYETYLHDGSYFGALIGRNSNRIEKGEFKINGKQYNVIKNDGGKNNIHGGTDGFNTKIWNAEAVDGEEPKLILTTVSEDGEEGFPGKVNVKVTYTLTKENAISIHYEGESDQDTILNMTNHSYFNLNGHTSGSVRNHTLWMDCDFYTPITENVVPDGTIISVKDTPFDFTTPKKVGQDIDSKHEQIVLGLGYDHNLIINGTGYRKFAVLTGDISGITMECYTDRPAVQLYTGNYVVNEPECKDNAKYEKNQGLCLETQVFPNFTKYAFFPGGILKKGEKYDTITEYKFYKKA